MPNPSELGRLLASLRPVKNLVCVHCEKEFQGRGRRRYCSSSCRYKAYYRRRTHGNNQTAESNGHGYTTEPAEVRATADQRA